MSVTTQPRAFAMITGSPAGCVHGRITYCWSALSIASAFGVLSPMSSPGFGNLNNGQRSGQVTRRFDSALCRDGRNWLCDELLRIAIPDSRGVANRAAVDVEDPVARGLLVGVVVKVRSRDHASHGDRASGTRERVGDIPVLVPVHDQIGAVASDHLGERSVIVQAADLARGALAGGRVVDRDQPNFAIES